MHKVLVIAPTWVGDLVMSQTLLKTLKNNYNNSIVLDIFAPEFLHSLIKRMPEVDEIITNPFQHKELNLFGRIKVGIDLRAKNYDEAIILPNSIKSALVPFFAGIKKRTGFVGESRYLLLNNIYKLNKLRLPLMIDRFCALGNNGHPVDKIDYPVLSIDQDNQKSIIWRFNLDTNKKLVAFCPAAEYGPAKRWPPEYFAVLADLIDTDIHQIVILGSAKDIDISDQITKNTKFPILDLCGKTTLADTVDLLALAHCTITNDSGLMHIAASVGNKVIAIYGSTSEYFTPPLINSAQIVKINLECSPCFQRTCRFGHYNCLKFITPKMIFEKINSC